MTDPTPFKVTETLETPNPLAYKYVLNQAVIDNGMKTFSSARQAEAFPFARAVFALGHVQNVFLKDNFISVTFEPNDNFELLVESVDQVIEDELSFYVNDADEDSDRNPLLEKLDEMEFSSLSDLEKTEVIDALLDESIRPALAQDGGGVNVLEVEGNIVRIQYQGACGGCPSSQTGTLRAIQRILSSTLKEELMVVSGGQ